MFNITVRNIPDEIIGKIKTLSVLERRSINNEILVILEEGLSNKLKHSPQDNRSISKSARLAAWENLCGAWKDDRSTKEIIDDIISHRTLGREVNL
jgi:plasmid stability protein